MSAVLSRLGLSRALLALGITALAALIIVGSAEFLFADNGYSRAVGPRDYYNFLDASVANNTTTLASIGGGLSKNVNAGESWNIRWKVEATMGSASGVSLAVTGPAGATLMRAHATGTCGNATANDNATTTFGSPMNLCTGSVTSGVFEVEASLTVGATAGTVGISSSQVNDSATNETVLAGAIVEAHLVNPQMQ